MFTAKELYGIIDGIMPFDTREEWDNSGLLLDCKEESENLLICLDVTKEAVAAAEKIGAKVILSHHPLIFDPLKNIERDSILIPLIKNGISVISAHTNFDNYRFGTAFCTARALRLDGGSQSGACLYAKLADKTTVKDFAVKCGKVFGHAALTSGFADKEINSVFICPGSGSGEKRRVIQSGADCFLTGECKYHDILDLSQQGIPVITLGHDAMERISLDRLKGILEPKLPGAGIAVFKAENLLEYI